MLDHFYRKALLYTALLISLFLLIACAGPGTISPTSVTTLAPTEPMAAPTEEAKPADLGKLVVAFGTTPLDQTAHFFAYALENGFYKEQGLEVEFLPLKGDQNAIRAVVSGDADVAWTGFVASLQANEAGADLVAFSGFNPKIDYLLVSKTEIERPKDIEGHKLGVSGPGAVSHQVPNLMIEADGGDPEKVELVAVGGSSSRVQALIAGDIDAAALNYVFSLRTKDYDNLHTIGDAASALPNYLYANEIADRKTLEEKADAIQAFVNGTMKAVLWANEPENFEKAVDISQQILPDTPRDELAIGLQHFIDIGYWNPSGVLPKEAFDFSQNVALEFEFLQTPLNYEDYWVGTFVEEASQVIK